MILIQGSLLIGTILINIIMENEIKSGAQILDDFFNEIENLPKIDLKVAKVFKSLYEQGKLTDTNVKNELQKVRESNDSDKD